MSGCILFSMGGVLTPTLDDLLLAGIADSGGEALQHADRRWVRDQCQAFHTGRLDAVELVRRALERAGLKGDPAQFMNVLLGNLAPDEDVLGVLDELKQAYDLWLLSDLPRAWVASAAARRGLEARVEGRNMLYIDELGIERLLPDLLEAAVKRIGRPLDEMLLVDSHSERTTQAVRMRLNAILFVNAFRFREELGLRKLLPPL